MVTLDNMEKTIIIAEVGLNYAYGTDQSKFIENAKALIDVAAVSGADYVKFQKRTPELCIPLAEREKIKSVPWRKEETTYFQYKLDIEFTKDQYREIDDYCTSKGIKWFASVWDKGAVDFMRGFETILPNGKWGTMTKIPSALINDLELVDYARSSAEFLLISTGMSTQKEIDSAIQVGLPDVVFHTNSTYPAPIEELNLEYITYLKHISIEFENKFKIGYSSHERSIVTCASSILYGATWVERHITLDRNLWGSDQLSSSDLPEFALLIKNIREIESSRGTYVLRKVLKSELAKRKTLRGK